MPFVPNRRMAPYTEEQKIKRQMILKINKRIHARHKKLGGHITENIALENYLKTHSMKDYTIEYESEEGYNYRTISTSRAALDALSMEDIEWLDERTPSWSQLRDKIEEQMGWDETDSFGQPVHAPVEEIRRWGEMKADVVEFIDESSENWYKLLSEMGEDHTTIKERSYQDMWDAIQRIRERENENRSMNERVDEYERLREAYWYRLNRMGVFKQR